MKQGLFSKTKDYIKKIKTNKVMSLFEYFDNSPEFTIYSEKRGVEISLNTNSVTYLDGEIDDRNYYKDYKAIDDSFIIRIDKYGIREGMFKLGGELFLEMVEGMDSEISVYRISCK